MQRADPARVTLYYREGASDKVYQCAIEPSGTGFVVNFAYGRRGSTLNTGSKTASPVDYDTARDIYDKLVRSKTAKGYTAGPDGTPYQGSAQSGQFTHILPQLLNPIGESDVRRLLHNPGWCMQEKLDGGRMMLRKQGAAIHGINRKGMLVGLPSPMVPETQKIPVDFMVDGECVGDVLYAFDLLHLGEDALLSRAYEERLKLLATLLESAPLSHIELVETAFRSRDKVRLYAGLQSEQREGVVFKQLDAPYAAGRPNSGGAQVKYKFTATLSAVVSKINAQRSVELRLIGRNGWVSAGNVTIPANHPVPAVGHVVEVRYLYAFPESGVLYQPVYLGRRTDIDQAECMTAQLKYKPADEEEDET